MSSENPYASPMSDDPPVILYVPSLPGVWRCRESVVVSFDAHFPERCVKCNQPTGGRTLLCDLWWHPGWVYLLIPAGLLPYVIVAFLRQRTMTVSPGICPEHLKRHRIRLVAGCSGIALSVGVPVALGIFTRINPGLLIGVGIIATLGFTIFAIMAHRFVAPSKLDNGFAWIKNTGREFRRSLPEWPGE